MRRLIRWSIYSTMPVNGKSPHEVAANSTFVPRKPMPSNPASEPSFIRILLLLSAFLAVVLAVLGITQDRNVVEKIGTALTMPSGMLWVLLMTLTIQLWLRHRRNPGGQPGVIPATMCFLLYSVAGSGFVTEGLARVLESDYVAIQPLEEESFDVVIVLGGGGSTGANGRQQGNSSGDRMILAAQLYHQHITKQFICTGQRIQSMNAGGIDPAKTSREILLRLGVPDSAIEMMGGRNTSEEMKELATRFGESKTRIGLLTSAWHLPRAMRLAENHGLNPSPLPADFRSSPRAHKITIGQFVELTIPSGSAFGSTWSFTKEFLGMLIGR